MSVLWGKMVIDMTEEKRKQLIEQAKKNVISRHKDKARKQGSSCIDSDEFTMEALNLAEEV